MSPTNSVKQRAGANSLQLVVEEIHLHHRRDRAEFAVAIGRQFFGVEPEIVEGDAWFHTPFSTHIVRFADRKMDRIPDELERLAADVERYEQTVESRNRMHPWLLTTAPIAQSNSLFDIAEFRGVRLLTPRLFASEFLDVESYLDLRAGYPFGSTGGPDNTQADIPDYIPLTITPVERSRGRSIQPFELAQGLVDGDQSLLIGEFGAGKSMTCREIFRILRAAYEAGEIESFPVVLNLAEHKNQDDPEEALDRHARNVKLRNPSQLAKAWKSGACTILLDGFDELTRPGWSGDPEDLKNMRFQTARLIRRFAGDNRLRVGTMVTGREHYFESRTEMSDYLFGKVSHTLLSLDDFNIDQIKEFMRRKGIEIELPSWLPTRPLLLTYFADGISDEVGKELDLPEEEAAGWDGFLGLISAREVNREGNVPPEIARLIVEKLATISRCSPAGDDKIDFTSITQAFKMATGGLPGDDQRLILERLPGLARSDAGYLSFMDEGLYATALAGELLRYVEDPYAYEPTMFDKWWSVAPELTHYVLAHKCKSRDLAIRAAFERSMNWPDAGHLTADLLFSALAAGEAIDGGVLNGCYFPRFRVPSPEMSSFPMSLVGVQESAIDELDLTECGPRNPIPVFVNCAIGSVIGADEHDMDASFIERNDVGSFDRMTDTIKSIMTVVGLNDEQKIGLSILHKLYERRGSGRQISAFKRGIEPQLQPVVEKVLRVLERHSLVDQMEAARSRQVWVRSKGAGARARAILRDPLSSGDSMMVELGGQR